MGGVMVLNELPSPLIQQFDVNFPGDLATET